MEEETHDVAIMVGMMLIFDLFLEGSVRHDADVENTEEAVDVTLAVRH